MYLVKLKCSIVINIQISYNLRYNAGFPMVCDCTYISSVTRLRQQTKRSSEQLQFKAAIEFNGFQGKK